MNIDLELRLKRLMLLRVVMVTTLLSIATLVEAVSETLLAVNPVYFVIVATYGLTVAYALALRFIPARWPQAYAQLVGDVLIITALVHVMPRERLGFVLLYPLVVLSATMLVSRRGALFVAGLASSLYGGLLATVHRGLLPPEGPPCRRGRSSTACFSWASRARRRRCSAPTWPRASSTRVTSCARPRSRWPTCAS
jgi:hypothetical protein